MEGQIGGGQGHLFHVRGLGPGEVQFLALGLGPVILQLLLQLFGHLLARTGLAGLGGLGAEAFHEGHLAGQFVLQGLGLALALGVVFLLEGEELGVGGLAEDRAGQAQIEHVRAHAVHEHAVVGHEDQGALEVHEEGLQPFHGFHVQMVGGFVQQQHVGPGGEHAGQLGAFAPAAGELAQGAQPLAFGKAQTGEHGLGAVFGIVAVGGFQLCLAVHELGQARLVLLPGGVFPLGPEFVPVVEHVQHIGQQGRVQGLFGKFLFHEAQAAAFGQDDTAAVGGLHAGQQAEEGGFAGPVGAADAQTHAGIHFQREIVEDVPSAEGLGQFLDGYFHSRPSRL